jgi:hypothetical protein
VGFAYSAEVLLPAAGLSQGGSQFLEVVSSQVAFAFQEEDGCQEIPYYLEESE